MKKLKLILSVCLMCLSVAVLCMGILAYNSATYKITGSMTYNMTADLAMINTRVYRVAGQLSKDELTTAIDGTTSVTGLAEKTYTQIERDTTTSYILHQKLSTLTALSSTETKEEYSSEKISMNFGMVSGEDEFYYTYYVVISIVNTSSDYQLSAELGTIPEYTQLNTYTNQSQTSIAKGKTKNIVIGFSKTDDTALSQDFTYTLTVESELSYTYDGVVVFKVSGSSTTVGVFAYNGSEETVRIPPTVSLGECTGSYWFNCDLGIRKGKKLLDGDPDTIEYDLYSVKEGNDYTVVSFISYYDAGDKHSSSLINLYLPETVSSLGKYAFYAYKGLKNIYMSNSVCSIGDYAFGNCSALTSITIPSCVTHLGQAVFNGCTSLTSVTFEDPNGWSYSNSEYATSGTSLTLTNPSTNATYLTSSYKWYYWNKS